MLELIELSRQRGHHRNLLVAATGTGKTVMAALDYATLTGRLGRSRLLFIAHREEILDQSLATFRYALRDASFGEKWVGGARPTRFDHVFASIQSLHAGDLDALPSDHFDVVIVDEFHHAAAASYRRILDHLQPVELLGLTATPERSDGLPILQWFDDRIATELRLWEAIDQQHLSPFLYFGIHDGLDLREIPWRRGRGYDVDALSNAYTSSDAWARLVVKEVADHTDPASMRALGFCVSVEHARFMAHHFNHHGIPSVAVWGDSPRADREAALRDLAQGRVRVVFSVDLFNEGVDVPAVDTVLMLRPTESPTLFLQQLGRGLRKSKGKGFCTVLDFVGTHRKEFRFDRRLRALLGGSRRDVERAVQLQFPFLPAGCHMHLDPKASEVVLRSLRDAIPTRWPAKVDELRSLGRERPDLGLAEFLTESGLDLDDIYDGNKSWSDLREAAGAEVLAPGPDEAVLRRAIGRLLHIDDRERIDTYRRHLASSVPPEIAALPERERRLLHISSLRWPIVCWAATPASRKVRTCCGPIHKFAANCRSCSACSMAASTTSTHRSPRIPTALCRSMRGTPESRSSPHLGSVLAPRSRHGRAVSTRRKRPTPSCSRSLSTRAAAASRRPPGTATMRSAAASSTGRVSPPRELTARPVCATGITNGMAARSCCSADSVPTIVPSGSSARPPTAATWASGRWPSPGSWSSRSRVTSTKPSPQRLREPTRSSPLTHRAPARDDRSMDMNLTLSSEDLAMIVEALDCYDYWELGQELPRNNGSVLLPGDSIGATDPYWTEPPRGELPR